MYYVLARINYIFIIIIYINFMGNCCFGKYKEENKYLVEKLVENEEKLQQSIIENKIYKNQLIITKAFFRNIKYTNGKLF